MSTPPAIKVENLGFAYVDGQATLSNLSFSLQPVERVALIGPNGAGKSTLVLLLAGLLRPSRGEILILGQPLSGKHVTKLRRNLGIVFQDPDDQLFSPHVFDEVAFAPLNFGFSREQIPSLVRQTLEKLHIAHLEHRHTFHLSFGEKKTVALSSVLVYEPDIILFDEPTSNLDSGQRRRFIEIIHSLQGKTVLIATQDLDLALELCPRTLLLYQGELKEDRNSSELLTNAAMLRSYDLEPPLSLNTNQGDR